MEGMDLHLMTFCWNEMCDRRDVFDAHQRRAIKKEILRTREIWLWDLIRDRGLSAANLTIEVAWAQSVCDRVVDVVRERKYDLVLKSVHASKTLLHTPLDWQLIHRCPAPLLLAGDKRRRNAKDVLATIDLRTRDRKHRTLNLKVLDAASRFARAEGANLHCVAVVEYSEVLRDLDIISVPKVRREVVAKTGDLLDALISRYDIARSRIHRPAGKVGQMVAATARKVNASLIVVGSAARRGPGAELLGGSAEKILSKAPCDVLTVHP
jgi:universal stress protein E